MLYLVQYLLGLLLVTTHVLAQTTAVDGQGLSEDLDEYLKLVRSTLFAIDQINTGNLAPCNTPGLVADLDAGLYDGDLVRKLICEVKIGIIVFPNLSSARQQVADIESSLQSIHDRPQCDSGSHMRQCLSKLELDFFHVSARRSFPVDQHILIRNVENVHFGRKINNNHQASNAVVVSSSCIYKHQASAQHHVYSSNHSSRDNNLGLDKKFRIDEHDSSK
ncbi:hypothetical protein TI39_contig399g00028 [Zymoseptoria brevis]|uniref:Uncharacterized protein n=1 Tax=Zymoseptoria brevis TaxID=1047168 RepID=A0A0F4GNM4_9PEZI|nr:hypothetical protein TI39_contig399g00028 [Zymoseptoria brevis]